MNDLAPAPAEALPEAVETVPNAVSATAPAVDAKPPSVAESIAKAAEKVLAEPEKAEPESKVEKPKAEAKPEVKVEAKPDAEEKPAKQVAEEKPDAKPVNAPARLLPKAREVWANTPRVVQSEFERLEREHATEIETHKAASAFHAELKDYDDMAKGAKTTVKQALDRYVQFDKALSQDFGQGMASLAQEQGKKPMEAVASFLKALGATPEQYAQHVLANPDQHKFATPQQPQQRAPDPVASEVQQLKQMIAEDRNDRIRQQTHAEIVAPFAAEHPRFGELEKDIAFFLQSGKVPDSLSAAERLEVAYDMAERLNPSPVVHTAVSDPDRIAPNLAGKKSISGAPGSNITRPKPKIMSVSDTIAANARRMGVA